MIAEKIFHFEHRFRPLLESVLRPSLFRKLYSSSRHSAIRILAAQSQRMKEISAETYPQELFQSKLRFRNDLGNAAGLDKDGGLLPFHYKIGAGFALVGTVLAEAHAGRQERGLFGEMANPWVPLPRSASAINSLGLPSRGAGLVRENICRFRDRYHPEAFPIGISVMGHPLQEENKKFDAVLEMMSKLLQEADFFELNESCPNTNHDQAFEALEARVRAAVELCHKGGSYRPLSIKLSGLDPEGVTLKILHELGVDAVTLCNTQTDYRKLRELVDVRERGLFDFYVQNFQGGVSGEVIRGIVQEQISQASQQLGDLSSSTRLIEVGGVSHPEHIQQSRKNERIILRQWYTGFMDALGSRNWKTLYRDMTKA